MPKNTNILLVRHGEKPDDKTEIGLSVAGQERALAYTIYFQNLVLDDKPLQFNYLFASHQSPHSNRPFLTLQPLAAQLKLPIDARFQANEDPTTGLAALVNYLLTKPHFDHSNLLVCWHHEQLLEMATGLGALPHTLPQQWPDEVFGWVLYLSYDANGVVTGSGVIEEKLMFNDHGQPPLIG
jgi:hypothetical protein